MNAYQRCRRRRREFIQESQRLEVVRMRNGISSVRLVWELLSFFIFSFGARVLVIKQLKFPHYRGDSVEEEGSFYTFEEAIMTKNLLSNLVAFEYT